MRDKYTSSAILTKPWNDVGFKMTLFYTVIIILGFGLLWMTVVACAPKLAPLIAGGGAILTLIALAVLAALSDRY